MAEILRKILDMGDRFVGMIPMHNAQFRRAMLILAVLALVVGIFLSIQSQPTLLLDARLAPIIFLALVAIPVTMMCNSVEFVLTARLIGHSVSLKNAFETTIIGGVANMLPLPGGAIVRMAALKAEGASFAKGTFVMLFVALIWAAVSFGYAGLWLVAQGATTIGALFIVIGILGVAGCFVASTRMLNDRRVTGQLFIWKFGLVLVDAFRLYLCLLALNVAAGFDQASVLTVSGFVGASFSIVPAGLGIREVVSALIGPLVGLTAASAFLASAVNRIIGLIVSAPIAAYLAWKTGQIEGVT